MKFEDYLEEASEKNKFLKAADTSKVTMKASDLRSLLRHAFNKAFGEGREQGRAVGEAFGKLDGMNSFIDALKPKTK